MKKLFVFIEMMGTWHQAGFIVGNNAADACFLYSKEYVDSIGRPISLSLPIQSKPFDAAQTRNFFEGLLPEGFSRRAVATWIHADENDYLTILEQLGSECLGAIRISPDSEEKPNASYVAVSKEEIRKLAAEGATASTRYLMESHLSLAGASGKVGLYYDKTHNRWYQPIGVAPSTHILKQSHVRLQNIVANELLCLLTARKLGIETSDSFLVNAGDGGEGDILFATERYDRKMSSDMFTGGLQTPMRLHQEDFSQALGIPAADKYEKAGGHYMKRMFECLLQNSANPARDRFALWDRIIFNYLIGNTDGHVKNYSLIYSPDLKQLRLAPAYDMISTRIYGSTKEMSFAIAGEYDISKINRDTFRQAAREVGLGVKMAMDRYDRLQSQFAKALEDSANTLEKQGILNVQKIREEIMIIGSPTSIFAAPYSTNSTSPACEFLLVES